MKVLVAYLVLVAIVFLNVPRSLVHDCHGDHTISHQDDEHDSSEAHIDQDDCFACEFDLSVSNVPSIKNYKFYRAFINLNTLGLVQKASNGIREVDNLRGPPSYFA